MNPCELNALIAAVTNQLWCSLSRTEFINLGILLSLISKDILSMAALEGLCRWEEREKGEPPSDD